MLITLGSGRNDKGIFFPMRREFHRDGALEPQGIESAMTF
jgi:hypothetical protein